MNNSAIPATEDEYLDYIDSIEDIREDDIDDEGHYHVNNHGDGLESTIGFNRHGEEMYTFPPDSELIKPWREMNPELAIQQARLVPVPMLHRQKYYDKEEKYPIVDGKVTFIDEKGKKRVLTRCPLCVRGKQGYIKIGDKYLDCRCCGGFMYVSKKHILAFFDGMKEMTEVRKIEAQTKRIVKDKRKKREEEIKKKEEAKAKAEKKAKEMPKFSFTDDEE